MTVRVRLQTWRIRIGLWLLRTVFQTQGSVCLADGRIALVILALDEATYVSLVTAVERVPQDPADPDPCAVVH